MEVAYERCSYAYTVSAKHGSRFVGRGDLKGTIDGKDVVWAWKPGCRRNAARYSGPFISRIIVPEIPVVVATQLTTTRSWLSRVKTNRAILPCQQVNSGVSEKPTLMEAAYHDDSVMSTSEGNAKLTEGRAFSSPVDALAIDGIGAGPSPLAHEERGDPPVCSRRRLERSVPPWPSQGRQLNVRH